MSELQLIRPHAKDLGGGFMVRRSLPAAQRQAVGPFLFFDHFGPITAGPADHHDVRPHPHIGLATVTYLFEGAQVHRDSTGVVQLIEPGAINWMTAGRGIVHSERTPAEWRGRARRSHGLQLWCALPAEHEEDPPSFQHTPAQQLPEVVLPQAAVRVLIGAAFGATSPVTTLSPTLYLDIALAAGGSLAIPDVAQERAVYSVDADITLGGVPVPAATLAVLAPGAQPTLHAERGARVVVIGGQPLGPRFMVWNFVSSRKERIREAEDAWEAQRFDPVPGETEFIPLPPRRL
ncbi:pirin family protein [Piscinibacter defluvii]|uniref:pirin family protein n=1 Tax=Piscinibacter defluvii TaxID=1796922 RepID=UPI000FDF17A7|nr:pirin family protein [Piscinibacter defluvii]